MFSVWPILFNCCETFTLPIKQRLSSLQAGKSVKKVSEYANELYGSPTFGKMKALCCGSKDYPGVQ